MRLLKLVIVDDEAILLQGFSHLFKQYTGKLPSEYKKEFEV